MNIDLRGKKRYYFFIKENNIGTSGFLDENKRERIIEYILIDNITRQDILEYANVFPDKVMSWTNFTVRGI